MKYVILFFSLFYSFTNAQSIGSEQPYSWTVDQPYSLETTVFEGVPFAELRKEDQVNDLDKSTPWRFGYDFKTDLDPGTHGEYIDFENGDRLWRIKIESPDAKTINIFFDWFRLEKGAWMQVASVDGLNRSKLFTKDQNNPNDAIGIWPIDADEVWVEFFEPAAVKGLSKLSIGNVVHGYRTVTDMDESKALNDSGACNQDVDCDITPNGLDIYNINQVKEDVKKSVALVLSNNTGWCSGALVNNTSNDGTPYFMTANHCLDGNQAGWAFRFNWRSTTTRCATFQNSVSGAFDQTANGAILRMASSESDMALLEITDTGFFNSNPDVVWAGWNRSTTQTPNVNFGVHHPSGDIQKTCRDDQGAVRNTRSFGDNPTTEMWLISNWDLGVTEPGSSGSPLFNEVGHVIGVLSGGSAACSGTVDNGGIDYYGRVGVGWNFGNSSSSRLRDWLDPTNTNQLTLDQFPSNQNFVTNVSISVSDLSSDDCDDNIEPGVLITNLGSQTITSLTLVYPDANGTPVNINYTGSIAQNTTDTLMLPAFDLNGVNVSYNVQATNPNGTVDEDLSNNNAATLFTPSTVPNFTSNGVVVFTILTDDYPSETSWELKDGSGTVIQSGSAGSFPSQGTSYSRNLNVQNGSCYEFTIFDSASDGICCGQFGDGNYTLTSDNGVQIVSGGVFADSESTQFSIGNTASIEEDALTNVTISPNPSTGLFFINNSLSQDLIYQVYDLSGKLIVAGKSTDVRSNLDLSQVTDGMYFVRVTGDNATKTFKVIKQ
jgi:V8-like Glu-specific endopeptidase